MRRGARGRGRIACRGGACDQWNGSSAGSASTAAAADLRLQMLLVEAALH